MEVIRDGNHDAQGFGASLHTEVWGNPPEQASTDQTAVSWGFFHLGLKHLCQALPEAGHGARLINPLPVLLPNVIVCIFGLPMYHR